MALPLSLALTSTLVEIYSGSTPEINSSDLTLLLWPGGCGRSWQQVQPDAQPGAASS